MKAKIGLIAAMEEELKPFLRLKKRNIFLISCGVGKVNAAAKSQYLVDKFSPDMVLITGVAGAVDSNLKIGDIIIADELVQWDVDGTVFGLRKGQIPFTDWCFFKTSRRLTSFLKKAFIKTSFKSFEQHKPSLIVGRIATGDTFVADKYKKKEIFEEFNCQAVDMESGAVAQVCTLNKVPFAVVKSISDKADYSAKIDFEKFLKLASENNFKLIKNFLGQLGEKIV